MSLTQYRHWTDRQTDRISTTVSQCACIGMLTHDKKKLKLVNRNKAVTIIVTSFFAHDVYMYVTMCN